MENKVNLLKFKNIFILFYLWVFIANCLLSWYSQELFIYNFLLFIIVFITLVCFNMVSFLFSVYLIKENKRKIRNWVPFLIVVVTSIFIITIPLNYVRERLEYKIYYGKRTEIVEKIKNGEIGYFEHNQIKLPDKYKKISIDKKAHIYLNKEEILISFIVHESFPDEGSEIVYSSNGEKLIRENIDSINKIEKRDENWYYVIHD